MFEESLPMTPAEEVEILISQARQVHSLNPTLQTIFDTHHDLFLDVFDRQINLLKTRSQAFEDAHITVYDKVLLALTDDGANLTSAQAITYYCAEYFGFNPDVAQDHNRRAIEQNLAFPVALALVQRPKAQENESKPARKPEQKVRYKVEPGETLATPAPTSPIRERERERKHEREHWTSKDEQSWLRFRDTYENARKEFNLVADDQSARTHEAARYLRDTAENGIHFLQQFPTRDRDLTELQHTYDLTRRIVEEMAGGKKRKFDQYANSGNNKSDIDQPALGYDRNRTDERKEEQHRSKPVSYNSARDGTSKWNSSTNSRELFPEQSQSRRRPGRIERRGAYGGLTRGRRYTNHFIDSYVPARDARRR